MEHLDCAKQCLHIKNTILWQSYKVSFHSYLDEENKAKKIKNFL